MTLGYAPPNRVDHWVPIVFQRTLDFDRNNESFAGTIVIRKRRSRRRGNGLMTFLHRLFDILRIAIDTAHNN